MRNKLALAALLLSAIGTTAFAAQPNEPTSSTANGVGTDNATSPNSGAMDNGSNGSTNGAPDTNTNTPNNDNTYNSSTGNNSGSTYNNNAGVSASKGPGLVEGVVETTDPDRIAAIEQHARQLESRQFDTYEAPAAGKRHHRHGHKHSGSKGSSKPSAPPDANSGAVQ